MMHQVQGAMNGLSLFTLPQVSRKAWAILVLAVCLVVLMVLAQGGQAAVLGRDVAQKQARLAELQRSNAQLRNEIAASISPSVLEPRAKTLGLGPAKSVTYADLPNLRPEMADVLPAFAPSPNAPLPRSDIVTQFTLWWDGVRAQLGLPLSGPVRAAPNTNP